MLHTCTWKGSSAFALAMFSIGCATTESRPVVLRNEPSVPALTQQLIAADSALKRSIADKKEDIEERLSLTYSELQVLCKAKFDELKSDKQRYEKSEARTNVIGSLLALIGSVTVYAPGKTILMGLGISTSGSGTVSSGITQFFSTRSSTDRLTLASLQNQLDLTLDRYDALLASDDRDGRKRSGILSRGKGICLGLSPVSDEADKQQTAVNPAQPAAPVGAGPATSAEPL